MQVVCQVTERGCQDSRCVRAPGASLLLLPPLALLPAPGSETRASQPVAWSPCAAPLTLLAPPHSASQEPPQWPLAAETSAQVRRKKPLDPGLPTLSPSTYLATTTQLPLPPTYSSPAFLARLLRSL